MFFVLLHELFFVYIYRNREKCAESPTGELLTTARRSQLLRTSPKFLPQRRQAKNELHGMLASYSFHPLLVTGGLFRLRIHCCIHYRMPRTCHPSLVTGGLFRLKVHCCIHYRIPSFAARKSERMILIVLEKQAVGLVSRSQIKDISFFPFFFLSSHLLAVPTSLGLPVSPLCHFSRRGKESRNAHST